MSGTLYVCGTPIGNLEDISLRVIRILKESDVIAAEDTRHTLKLLNFYEISTPLISYHQHNTKEKSKEILNLLLFGKNIALVTDAGMPAISDPGQELVSFLIENNISVTSAPGPTALTTALAISGLNTRKFIFEGFLPQGKKERKEILECYKYDTKTLVFYEAPHHLKRTLNDMLIYLGNRNMAITRELTKKYEETLTMTTEEFVSYFEAVKPRGEYVIIIEGITDKEAKQNSVQYFENIPFDEHMKIYTSQGMSEKDAMKAVAKDKGISKRDVYSNIMIKKH